jgi:hypothetical protein
VTPQTVEKLYHDTTLLIFACFVVLVLRKPIVALLGRISKNKNPLTGETEFNTELGTPAGTIKQAVLVAENPDDKPALYQLLASTLDNTAKQHLILMTEKNVLIPYVQIFGHRYQFGTKGKYHAVGMFDGDQFLKNSGAPISSFSSLMWNQSYE